MDTPPTEPGALDYATLSERPPWAGALGVISIVMAGLTFIAAVYAPMQIFSMRLNRELWADGRFEQIVNSAVQKAGNAPNTPATPAVDPDDEPDAGLEDDTAAEQADAPVITDPNAPEVQDPTSSPPQPAAIPPQLPRQLSMMEGMFNYPVWFESALAVRGVLDLLLSGLLLFGGIQLLRQKHTYRPALLMYAVLGLVAMIGWVVTCVISKSFMSMTPAMCAIILGLPFPVVVLVFMFGEQRMAWYQRLRNDAHAAG